MAIQWLDHPSNRFPARLLAADWFANIARKSGLDLERREGSWKAFILGPPQTFHVTAHAIDEPPFLKFVASDPNRQGVVDAIAVEAAGRVERGDLDVVWWYSADLHEVEHKPFSSSIMGPLLERIGGQVRISGLRKLGLTLLEFSEELPPDWDEKKALLAPKATVHVHIGVQGPWPGHFASWIAHSLVETVTAICTFALGRSVALPPSLFPSEPETVPQTAERQASADVGILARKGVSLDIIYLSTLAGGDEVAARARGALLTFDAAARQESDTIACILYVVAAEALTPPSTQWRHNRVTKRFVEFFDELMPTWLDKIVAHGNFEEVFDIRRSTRSARALRRALLNRIYDYRSGQLHQGLYPSYRGFVGGAGFDMRSEIRRMLLASFAEGAILNYLAAPRVTLIGHPAFDRPDLSEVEECGDET
jgi:hypothetical protein